MLSSSLPRQDFVQTYVDYMFNRSVFLLFESFFAGFHKVCGGKVLELFQPNELQAMVIGNTNYDWKELEKVWLTTTMLFFNIKWETDSFDLVNILKKSPFSYLTQNSVYVFY